MEEGRMVRRQLYLPDTLNKKLKEWSRFKKISESEIMRHALSEYLEQEKRRHTPYHENPVLKMKGLFEGDASCFRVSENHDQIIYNLDHEE
jgi:metal-responsive CopG/Arc/MetJ family transcriptional regulator